MADEDTQAANDAIRDAAKAAQRKEGDQPETDTGKPAENAGTKADDEDEELRPEGKKALDAFKKRAREAEDAKRELETKVKEFEDRDKSEQEKLEERAATAERQAEQAQAQLLRIQVATNKKLPLELASRLQGKDKKELEADADRLLELVKPNGKPAGDVDAGKGEGGGSASFNDLMRATARK